MLTTKQLTLLSLLLTACSAVTTESGDAGDQTANNPEDGNDTSNDPDESLDNDAASMESFDWLDCSQSGEGELTVAPARVSDGTLWQGTIRVASSIEIGGALTIAAGTTILMAPDAQIDITHGGDLRAEGTESEPVRFCAAEENASSWRSIRFLRSSNGSLQHVLIMHGGGGESAAALELQAPVLVENVQVRQSASAGVIASSFRARSHTLSVEASGSAPVILTNADSLTSFPVGGQFRGGADQAVLLAFDYIRNDTTIRAIPIPYAVQASIDVSAPAFTIEPGVQFRMDSGVVLELGWSGTPTIVKAQGTAPKPIIFRGSEANAGHWNGVLVAYKVHADSILEHVQIQHAGYNQPALQVLAPIALSHVTVSDSQQGVQISAAGLAPTAAALTVTRTTESALVVAPDALPSLPADTQVIDNAQDRIEVRGKSYNRLGTIPNLGVPYYVADGIEVREGGSLRPTPGVTFHMGADTAIEVGWAGAVAEIQAEGTAGDPIRFLGAQANSGHWRGILVNRNVRTTSVLRNVEIAHAGSEGIQSGALTLRVEIQVEQCTFSDSAGFGIVATKTATRDYVAPNTFRNVYSGNVDLRL